jgi:hypothetical protein
LSSRRHRRPADAFVPIISPINDSAVPLWLILTSAIHESRALFRLGSALDSIER